MSLNFTTGQSSQAGAATTAVVLSSLLMLVFGREEKGFLSPLASYLVSPGQTPQDAVFSLGVVSRPSLLLTQFTSGPNSRHAKKFLSRTFVSAGQISSTYPSCISCPRTVGTATGDFVALWICKETERLTKCIWVPVAKKQGSEAPAITMGLMSRAESKGGKPDLSWPSPDGSQ